MAKRNGSDTDTTTADILREISAKLDQLEEIGGDVKSLKTSALLRDRQLEARVTKLETEMGKLRARRS